MRELREFREAYQDFRAANVEVAGVSSDGLASHRFWAKRLRIPFPLLSDPGRRAARELGLLRPVGIAGWTVELMRRCTLLVAADGRIAGAWGDVKVRGHARDVLAAARALAASP